jgi:hypothetical protein
VKSNAPRTALIPRIEQPLNQIRLVPPQLFLASVGDVTHGHPSAFIWTASSAVFRAILQPEKVQFLHISDYAIATNVRCGLSAM